MAQNGTQLDPILTTRLQLLERAVDEVKGITEEMEKQHQHLEAVGEQLRPGGTMFKLEQKLEAALGDAETRLNVVLGHEPEEGADPEPLQGVSQDAEDWLREARRYLSKPEEDADSVRAALNHLRAERTKAFKSFRDVRRWSVAGLQHDELSKAAWEFDWLIKDISKSPEPWRRYQKELRGRGEELFSRYLELLGGMAVRGLQADVRDDGVELRSLVLTAGAVDLPSLPRSPVLMGTRHLPLGYPEWNLWTLPLSGQPIAEKLIAQQQPRIFQTEVPEHLLVYCADAYVLHVLGPSYAFAAIFVALHPDDVPGEGPSDPVRAQLLLGRLPQLDDADPVRKSLEGIRQQLEGPWRQARAAFGGQDQPLPEGDRQILDTFFAELRKDFDFSAYDATRLSDAEELSKQLLAEEKELPEETTAGLKDLLLAIWLARLEVLDPDKARSIHRKANSVRRRGLAGGRHGDRKTVKFQPPPLGVHA
jgi:hypothetical protein